MYEGQKPGKVTHELGAMAKERQEKHIELNREIDNLDDVISHASGLISRIKQSPECDKPNPPTNPSATLEEVLSDGSRRIAEKSKELHELLNILEEILF